MKKRSMLAIASLASGFVVAAVTPSHALGGDTAIGGLNVEGTLSTVDTLASDSLAMGNVAPGQKSVAPGKSVTPGQKKGAAGHKH